MAPLSYPQHRRVSNPPNRTVLWSSPRAGAKPESDPTDSYPTGQRTTPSPGSSYQSPWSTSRTTLGKRPPSDIQTRAGRGFPSRYPSLIPCTPLILKASALGAAIPAALANEAIASPPTFAKPTSSSLGSFPRISTNPSFAASAVDATDIPRAPSNALFPPPSPIARALARRRDRAQITRARALAPSTPVQRARSPARDHPAPVARDRVAVGVAPSSARAEVFARARPGHPSIDDGVDAARVHRRIHTRIRDRHTSRRTRPCVCPYVTPPRRARARGSGRGNIPHHARVGEQCADVPVDRARGTFSSPRARGRFSVFRVFPPHFHESALVDAPRGHAPTRARKKATFGPPVAVARDVGILRR
ncbi:hypothetical protein BE221DRAFT_166287 [Ostreococcus tauri]|uniref:Uncharacterized protein n=1 Tax=Ostreococcus tauri TaxID=70448 RepID=A0A1Y5ICQ7_OSTTA|nr:hypothetical protein BE221DRAFT_166287 [Ostreococcus tauri]